MIKITKITARQILDSRGYPTVECDVILSDGAMGRAAVPSGASTGSREALELRDGGQAWDGKSVAEALRHIEKDITPSLLDVDPFDQSLVDRTMWQKDGTTNKSNFGANAILAVSLANAKACADSSGIELYKYIQSLNPDDNFSPSLPMPMMNIMNGGKHAGGATDFQEYMIIPLGANSWQTALEMGGKIFHTLGKILARDGLMTTVGDEGGYALKLGGGNRAPLLYIIEAIQSAGYAPGRDVCLGLDVAASELYTDGKYSLVTENRLLGSEELISYYQELCEDFPIISIEDGLGENDWENWSRMTEQASRQMQLVGDDLLVTNSNLLQKAVEHSSANAILIKPNQIGSLTETINTVRLAQRNGWRTIISHRSGETEDTTIAHLAVGLGAGQIKTGSLSRGERIAKYNEISRIAEGNQSLALSKSLLKGGGS